MDHTNQGMPSKLLAQAVFIKTLSLQIVHFSSFNKGVRICEWPRAFKPSIKSRNTTQNPADVISYISMWHSHMVCMGF